MIRSRSHAEVLSLFSEIGAISFSDFINIDEPPDRIHPTVPARHIAPAVYAWVEHPPSGEPTIIYIGKAGQGIAIRHRQHLRGYFGRGRGSFYRTKMVEILRTGSRIAIHAYYPPAVDVLGEMVPSQSVVEETLLASIVPKPILNREAKMKPICPIGTTLQE
jgi:hypothetical protein